MSRLSNKEWFLFTQVLASYVSEEGLPVGISYMNALHYVRPDLHTEIEGTIYDPSNDHNRIALFITYLLGEK